MKKITRDLLFAGPDQLAATTEIGLLIPRVAFGLSFALAHGLGKLPVSDQFIDGVAAMGLPMPTFFAWCAALSEFAGGLLVAIGLFTRPAALFATITMSVAFFIAHSGDPFSDREMALLYGTVMLGFCIMGAGRVSVDRILR